jgi:hypothetical protein
MGFLVEEFREVDRISKAPQVLSENLNLADITTVLFLGLAEVSH